MTETQLLESTRRPPLKQEQDGGAVEKDSRLRELDLWLHALASFFSVRNHPLTEAERAGVCGRNFRNEVLVAQCVLRRCAQLAGGVLSGEYRDGRAFKGADDHSEVGATAGDAPSSELALALLRLREPLGDVCALTDALLEAPAVSFHAWASLGRICARELRLSEVDERLAAHTGCDPANDLAPALFGLTERLLPDALGADMLAVFSAFSRLLERLRFAERSLRGDLPLKQLLPVFTLVREEARALLEMVETRTLRIESLNRDVFDVLDGTAYAVRMELRKTFEFELAGLSASRQAPQVYAKVENAHGLLRDCFQQSVVALAQIFEPELDGRELFSTFRTKLEQSLALRQDIWSLLRLVRAAQKESDGRALARLPDSLNSFREGSLRHLMYKDWESYERFAEEVSVARGAVERAGVLHRFEAYLETLFGQINMRAVLAEHPFDPKAAEEELTGV